MAEPYLSEIRIFGFNFPPRGWAFCDGQLLQINQNQALFSLIGTTYGGDGQTTFALPNLQGRSPLHAGGGLSLGAASGEPNVALTLAQMPGHTHTAMASSNAASASDPANAFWAQGSNPAYAPAKDVLMAAQAVSSSGQGQAHENMSPYLTLLFCIALQGIYPSRN